MCGGVAGYKASKQKMDELISTFQLSEDSIAAPVSDMHIQEISRSHCRKWRDLPAPLEMEDHHPDDIEHDFAKEVDRRKEFLKAWQSEKGSDANYKKLISGLLVIKCKQDAEYVCGLLRSTTNQDQEGNLSVCLSRYFQQVYLYQCRSVH